MRGVYEACYSAPSVNTARTLMYITAPSGAIVEVLSASVTNVDNDTNEQLECSIQKVSTLGSPTATSITPTRLESGGPTAGSTVAANITASEPSYATGVEVNREGWPSLGGWRYQPVPEERLHIGAGQTWGIRMLSTPVSHTSNVKVVFREIG